MTTETLAQTPEQAAVAAWQAAVAHNDAVYAAAQALCAPYVCIGGVTWNAPAWVEPLDALLHSGEWPSQPWDKNFSIAKVQRGARAMERYTRKIEHAVSGLI